MRIKSVQLIALTAIALLGRAPVVFAQSVEVSPFGGYRFGNGLFENLTGGPLDVDGAPAVGIIIDVPTMEGFQIEGSYSHQHADIRAPAIGGPARWRISVDQWLAGGLQGFGGERIDPFLTGMLGLTRFAAEGDREVRFTAGAGGGVKLFPVAHVGVRLEGRVFATFVDAAANTLACGGGGCLVALHLDLAWQAEFTAAIVVRLPGSRAHSGRQP